MDHAVVEVFLLGLGRKFAVKQQVTGLQEVAIFGQLLDRIAAVLQNAGIAVDVGDLGLAARGGGKTRIIGKHAGLGIEFRDVDHIGADGAVQNRKIVGLVADRQRCVFGVGFCVHREVLDEIVAKTGVCAP